MHLVGVFMCDHGHNLLHSKLGLVHPRIVFAPPPHDHPQLAACRERAPDVSQRKSGQIEKHRAKPGEDVIVRTPKIIPLRFGYKEPSVLDRCFGSFACCEVDEILRAVDAYGVTTGAYLCRDAPRRVAETATDIEHAPARWKGLALEEFVAVTRKTLA